MEKFSTWRDKGTGISPFMPIEAAPTSALSKYVVKPILFVAKFPILIISLLTFSLILPLPAISNFILVTLYGFRKIETTVDGVKKSKINDINKAKPAINDFIIVNYIAPINGLILASVSQCSWRNIVILIPNKKGQLYSFSIWEVFTITLGGFVSMNSKTEVTDFSTLKGKLVFLFPEGTTSNNRAVLPFISLNKKYSLQGFNFKTISIKLNPANFTTPLSLASKFEYTYSMLTNLNAKSIIKVKIFEHQSDELDYSLAKKSFELNQLNSVGSDFLTSKEKFQTEYLKVKK